MAKSFFVCGYDTQCRSLNLDLKKDPNFGDPQRGVNRDTFGCPPPRHAFHSLQPPPTGKRRNVSNSVMRRNRSSTPQLKAEATPDDDFLYVDLLDGDHIPSHWEQTRNNASRMTANTEAILSHPSLEPSNTPETWHKMRQAQANAMRKGKHRIVNSFSHPSRGHDHKLATASSSKTAHAAGRVVPGAPLHPVPAALLSTQSNATDRASQQPPLPPSVKGHPNPTVPQPATSETTLEEFSEIEWVRGGRKFPRTSVSDEVLPCPPAETQGASSSNALLQPSTAVASSSGTHMNYQPMTVAQLASALQSKAKTYTRTQVPQGGAHSASGPHQTAQSHYSISMSRETGPFARPDSSTPLRPSVSSSDEPPLSGHQRHGSYKWYDEENNTYAPTAPMYTTPSRDRRRRRREKKHTEPQQSDRRDQIQRIEDVIMPKEAWIYLLLIGAITFITAYVINTASGFVAAYIIQGLAGVFGSWLGYTAHTVSLALLRGLSLALSFVIAMKMSPHYGAGSGIPEMKCVLGGVVMAQTLNWRTLVGKMVGLIFSLASSISIGRLGPFIHMSCISASLVSELRIFPQLQSNKRFQLQAFSAAMAAGVGATFGAPLGGTLLAVEIMSTYYYIHWLPMALYCSISGYYFLFALSRDSQAYFSTGSIDLLPASLDHLFTYILLGAMCGVIGALLVHFSKAMFRLRRQYFKNALPWRTAGMVVVFGAFHSLISTEVGGVLGLPQRRAVDQLFMSKDTNASVWLPGAFSLFPSERLNSATALIVVMVTKFFLTGTSIVMPVPCGVFMPIFLIGALFGRAFGEALQLISIFKWIDPQCAAIVGAAAISAGALHTVSVAVVMLELTREAIDVLPLAIGVIVSYGVSKNLCSDLFSELIRIRKLPYILGLRERYPWENRWFYEEVTSIEAKSIMKKDFLFVTPYSTRLDIWEMISSKNGHPWTKCALLSDPHEKRLWGLVSKDVLWDEIYEDMPAPGPAGTRDEPEYGTFDASESAMRRGLETIPFLRNFNPSVGHPRVDSGPMQMSNHTPFWKIIMLFRMLSMGQMYVTEDGKTVGCISKMAVINASIYVEEILQRRRRREETAAANGGGNRMQGRPPPGTFSDSYQRNSSLQIHNGLQVPEAFRRAPRGGFNGLPTTQQALQIGRGGRR